MYEEKVTLVNEIGLHARPASIFIREEFIMQNQSCQFYL